VNNRLIVYFLKIICLRIAILKYNLFENGIGHRVIDSSYSMQVKLLINIVIQIFDFDM